MDYLDPLQCAACPRECMADRTAGSFGFCECDDAVRVASICAHMGEEPVLSGEFGICNIFFGHCNLQCRFCQNHQISSNSLPLEKFVSSLEDVLDQIRALLARGVKGVGFVSPSHCVRQMLRIMDALEAEGHRPTFVYNSNGYDRTDVIQSMEDRIDVYLPDLKYMDNALASEYSGADDYVEHATAALKEMYRQRGADIELKDGLITRGMIIRHLVLPGNVENSKAALRFVAEELSSDLHISLMSQYHPTKAVTDHPKLGRRLRVEEYDEVLDEFDRLGFHRGWVQELASSDHYLPDFDHDHPFED